MERVVVDSSVAIKWFLAEPLTTEARRLLDGFQAQTLELVAPELIFAEVGNILWKRVQRQLLRTAEAEAILAQFVALGITTASLPDLLPQALHLALVHQRTVYDCLFLALAAREGASLVTADERLMNALQNSGHSLIHIASWQPIR